MQRVSSYTSLGGVWGIFLWGRKGGGDVVDKAIPGIIFVEEKVLL